MALPFLATKLYVPPPRPKVVARPRLMERLNEGYAAGRIAGVTLICAPAGFGKTTLISEWVKGKDVAWLSLDERDNDPTRFLTYLVAAVRTIAPNVGKRALGALQMLPPPVTESILTELLNDITAIPHDFALVLDDYHLID